MTDYKLIDLIKVLSMLTSQAPGPPLLTKTSATLLQPQRFNSKVQCGCLIPVHFDEWH